jgi:3-isopropylmalate/(R)-2-methylmalate dehydratase large subunit
VLRRDDHCLLYVDRHIIHDGSFHAFGKLAKRGVPVRRPRLTFGTPDHYVPTVSRSSADAPTPEIRRMVETEQGITLPGLLLVCGDSHTSTHGALGAFAFGIGQSENEHVLATQTIWQAPQKTMRITVDGRRPEGVSAKDVLLAIIAKIGAGGAVGHVVEYAGAALHAMSVEERMTVCNMSIEAGARAGMVAPTMRPTPTSPAGRSRRRARSGRRARALAPFRPTTARASTTR